MPDTIRNVLKGLSFAPDVSGCPKESTTSGHKLLRKRWHDWDEIDDEFIDWFLKPILDETVDWRAPDLPTKTDLRVRSELRIEDYFNVFFRLTENKAITHICKRLGVEPVVLRHSENKLAEGLKIKPDWRSGKEDNENAISLPGDQKATCVAYLQTTFDADNYKPDDDISGLTSVAWRHTRRWLGQVVDYAEGLLVRYFFLLTAHKVVLGRITFRDTATPMSKQDRRDVKADRADLPRTQDSSTKGKPGALDSPTPANSGVQTRKMAAEATRRRQPPRVCNGTSKSTTIPSTSEITKHLGKLLITPLKTLAHKKAPINRLLEAWSIIHWSSLYAFHIIRSRYAKLITSFLAWWFCMFSRLWTVRHEPSIDLFERIQSF